MIKDELVNEYKKTLEILYKQKDIITKNLENNKDFSNISSFLEQLIKIDENIKEYIIKIKDIEKENINEKIEDISTIKNSEKNNDSNRNKINDKISKNKSKNSDENIIEVKKIKN